MATTKETTSSRKNTVTVKKIDAKYDQNEFLRKFWITLAKENAPIYVFKEDIFSFRQIEHQVVQETVTQNIAYHVSIGYDREEPYTDYESYSEKIPYTDFETYTENGVKRQRAVTKYRTEWKQMAVTKYRTVTDWSFLSSNDQICSSGLAENLSDVVFDEERFTSSLKKVNKKSLTVPPKEIADTIQITSAARAKLKEQYFRDAAFRIEQSLPGDRYRDFRLAGATLIQSSSTIYLTPEYNVSLYYDGHLYTKKCFPFGSAKIVGDVIENVNSPENVKQQEERKLNKKVEQEKSRELKPWTAGMASVAVCATLLAFAFWILAIVLDNAYLLGIGLPVLFLTTLIVILVCAHKMSLIKQRAKQKLAAGMKENAERNAEYTRTFKARQLEMLNQKLRSINAEPATAEELEQFYTEKEEEESEESDEEEGEDEFIYTNRTSLEEWRNKLNSMIQQQRKSSDDSSPTNIIVGIAIAVGILCFAFWIFHFFARL